MRLWISILIVFFISLFQITLTEYISISGIFPNLVLVLALVWCVVRGFRQGVIWAFTGGLFLDLFSIYPFGAITLSLIFAVVVSSLINGKFAEKSSFLSIFVTCFAATIFYNIFFYSLASLSHLIGFSGGISLQFSHLANSMFLQFIYNLAFIFIFYYLFLRFSEWLKRREHNSRMPYKSLRNGSI